MLQKREVHLTPWSVLAETSKYNTLYSRRRYLPWWVFLILHFRSLAVCSVRKLFLTILPWHVWFALVYCINIRVNFVLFLFSKTPIEILHTILLGPVKYLLSSTIKSLNQHEKDQLHAKISALDMSAFAANIRGNITRNYGSYVGRDFKLWMQVAVFVLQGIIPDENLLIWELLSEVRRAL